MNDESMSCTCRGPRYSCSSVDKPCMIMTRMSHEALGRCVSCVLGVEPRRTRRVWLPRRLFSRLPFSVPRWTWTVASELSSVVVGAEQFVELGVAMRRRARAASSPPRRVDSDAESLLVEEVLDDSSCHRIWRKDPDSPRLTPAGVDQTQRPTSILGELCSIFLPVGYPDSVRPEYLRFQAFDTLQVTHRLSALLRI